MARQTDSQALITPEQIIARTIQRKSQIVPTAPAKYLIAKKGEPSIEELLQRKAEVLANRLKILEAREAELLKQKAKTKPTAKKPAKKPVAKPSKTSSKAPAKKTVTAAKTTKATPSAKTTAADKKAKTRSKSTKSKSTAQVAEPEGKAVSARSVRIPRRTKVDTPRKRGSRAKTPPEQVVSVQTVQVKSSPRPMRSRKKTKEEETARVPEKTVQFTLPGGIQPYQPEENEVYMSAGQLEHFRSLLQAQLDEHNNMIQQTLAGMQEKPTLQADPLDQANQEAQVEIDMRARERERKAILKIQSSITSIASGHYGYCKNCDMEIGIRRLEARPTATLCIDCKSMDEAEEKIYV